MKNGYTIYNPDTASKDAQVILNKVQAHYQFIPNAMGAMVESPATAQSYMQLTELAQQTSFSELEQHIIFLTVSREYGCSYCVAAHTAFAQMGQVDGESIQQLRNGESLSNKKLEALQKFTRKMVQTGCNVSERDIEAFLSQGYTRRNVLELVLLMTNKLIAVFSNRIMGTDLDEALVSAQWEQVSYAS